MFVRSLLHKTVSFFVVMGLLLTPVSPTPVQAAAPQVVDTPALPGANPVDSPISLNAPDVPNLPAKGEAPQPVNPIARALRDGTWPAQLVGSTGNIQSSRNGPQRNDPSEGIPVHAYSPFDERNNREHPCPPGGCEFETDVVLVKLAPTVIASRTGPLGAWTNNSALNQALAVQGFTQMEPLFPTAVRPIAGLSVERADGSLTEMPDLTRWYRVRLGTLAAQGDSSPQNVVLDAVQQLAETPGIDYAEPDYLRKPVGEPIELTTIPSGVAVNDAQAAGYNDPLYNQQWHLGATNVPQAWEWLTSQSLPAGGSRDIVVAVIDTGVDYTHPDLAANMWVNPAELAGVSGMDDDGNGFVDDIHGANVVSNQHSGDPQDDHGHGTHVAGIIAAQANNGIGGVGVAYNVQVMAIKAAQYSGVLSASDIAQGIYYAVAQGADVINMSFGGYARSLLEEDALAVAFGQAVLVAAAGNDGKVNVPCPFGRDMYPAAYNWVLGVMARQQNADAQGDYLAGFSNYDCKLQDSHEYEMIAPGVDVWSTLPNGQYAAWDGTSMAAPVVAGIAALARTKWADKDVFSSRFIMGQLATTGGLLQAYTPPQGLPVSYYVPNALSVLMTTPEPKLTYLEHWTFDTATQAAGNDNDGIVDAGETIDLAIVIRNHWGKADNVQITLSAQAGVVGPDPYVTMITPTVNYGAVGSFNIDDNGLIYDNDAIVGVQHPFRFQVSPNTPNDHLIPFKLTMTATNGYDPADPSAPYTFSSSFYLLVQRGRELPRIISEDMTLTKDNLWLVSDSSLIEAGVHVTVTEGTQIQFFSVDPNNPYAQNAKPKIQVEGTLDVQGSASQPVEMFTGLLFPAHPIVITQVGKGNAYLRYTRIMNPVLGNNYDFYSGMGLGEKPLTLIEHTYLVQEAFDCIRRYYYWDTPAHWGGCDQAPIVNAHEIRGAVLRGLGMRTLELIVQSPISTSLMDANVMRLQYLNSTSGNVFLKNYKLFETQWGSREYWVSPQAIAGPVLHLTKGLLTAFPTYHNGVTYVAVANQYDPYLPDGGSASLDIDESFAAQFGGHVVTINNELETQFLLEYRANNFNQTTFQQAYPNMNCGTSTCWDIFNGDFFIGLTDRRVEGRFEWLSGEQFAYSNWYSDSYTHQPDNGRCLTCEEDYVRFFSNGTWWDQEFVNGPVILELPGVVSQAQLDVVRTQMFDDGSFNNVRNNAFLNVWWDPNINHWMQFKVEADRNYRRYLTGNWWGTTNTTLIDAAIQDYNDDFNKARYIYEPKLTAPPETAYPFVSDVIISTAGEANVSIVGAEPVTFTVKFNRDMNTAIQPAVSFGPDVPETDYTIHAINGGWADARTWQGVVNITPVTGDGYQFMRIAGAVAADDPWLVTGDDSERFRFEVITSGTEAMNLQATGGEGYVDLSWTQDDFELLAGFNLYRAETITGTTYTRINTSIIPPTQKSYRDTNVLPGQPYFYKFTIVKSDMTESDFSNTATATPLDTVLPVISHTPLTSAAPGLAVSLFADVTDNVAVQSVTLFHRRSGTSTYSSRAMVKTTGDRYTATLEGTLLVSPGVDYYIEASDGVNIVRNGRPELPNTILVDDRPTVTNVTPSKGSAAGGTVVTIVGSNFKAGASVTFGGAVAEKVQIQSSSRISATTPAHFPAKVDVQVVNSDGQQGSLLQAFTYESDAISVSVANGNGGQGGSAELAISASNVKGLVAADLTLSFDSAILRGVSARTGNLTPGWTLTTNTATAGQVRLSFVSTGGAVTGSGVLAYVTFDVLGAPGTSTALQLSALSFNGGAIPTQTTNGTFNVDNVYDVAGTISFWNGGVVSNTLLAMQGDRLFNGISQSDGAYTVRGAPAGNYTLTPSKSDNVNGISAYDASLVLQHAVGSALLTGSAATAGDIDRSGQINSMDAYYILQKAVDLIPLPFPGAGKVWTFSPATRSVTGLNSHRTGEDFAAILIGDVSGNWNAPSLIRAGGTSATELGLQVQIGSVDADNAIPVTVQVNPAGVAVQSLDLLLTYDPALVAWDAVDLGDLGNGWMVAKNGTTPGQLSVALAGATPITKAGVLLTVRFHALTQSQGTGLSVVQVKINEAPVPVELLDSGVTGTLYLPILVR